MAYITRELERKFLKLNDFFKVILVTGARQVGKTTMLKHLAESSRTYVTMDNTMARALAQSDAVPISRPFSLTRCKKHRSCLSKSKSFATRAMKKG